MSVDVMAQQLSGGERPVPGVPQSTLMGLVLTISWAAQNEKTGFCGH